MNQAAILDNTVLANFMDNGLISTFEKLRLVFNYFLIPVEVENEFLKVPSRYLAERQRFADKFRLDVGFYRLCNSFDPIVRGELVLIKDVDPGEADAIAQAVRRNVWLFLTDDRRCSRFITNQYPFIRCYNSLFLIALLDCLAYIDDIKQVWQVMHPKMDFKSKDLREAYLDAYAYLSMSPDSKIISKKSQLKKILS